MTKTKCIYCGSYDVIDIPDLMSKEHDIYKCRNCEGMFI